MVNKSRKLLMEKMKKVLDLAENKYDIGDKEFYAALDCLHDEIKDMPGEVGWILVSERLPEMRELDKNCCALVTCGNGEVAKIKFNTMHMNFSLGDGVTAWMPIPRPYCDITEALKKWFGKK